MLTIYKVIKVKYARKKIKKYTIAFIITGCFPARNIDDTV